MWKDKKIPIYADHAASVTDFKNYGRMDRMREEVGYKDAAHIMSPKRNVVQGDVVEVPMINVPGQRFTATHGIKAKKGEHKLFM